jgi:hypothetical protein
MEVFPDNILCCFTVKLPQVIQLDHEAHWEVALVEMIHLTQILNIVPNQNTLTVEVHDEHVKQSLDKRTTASDSMKTQDHKTNRDNYLFFLAIILVVNSW